MLQPNLTRTWWDAGCANQHRLRAWFRPLASTATLCWRYSFLILDQHANCFPGMAPGHAASRASIGRSKCRTHGKSCRNIHQRAQRRNMSILLGVMATLNLGLPRHVVLGFSCELIRPVRPDCPTLRYTVQERVTGLCGSRFITSHFSHESCTPEVTSCPVCACCPVSHGANSGRVTVQAGSRMQTDSPAPSDINTRQQSISVY
jgi:hypothetical protein